MITPETIEIAKLAYYKPTTASEEDFLADLNAIRYIKRLLKRKLNGGDLKHILIRNHLITFFNVFSRDAGVHILRHSIEKEYDPILKPFLVKLNVISKDDPRWDCKKC